jgi:hypothetical protein
MGTYQSQHELPRRRDHLTGLQRYLLIFLKCQMFGRTHLDLLRVKVLHAV